MCFLHIDLTREGSTGDQWMTKYIGAERSTLWISPRFTPPSTDNPTCSAEKLFFRFSESFNDSKNNVLDI